MRQNTEDGTLFITSQVSQWSRLAGLDGRDGRQRVVVCKEARRSGFAEDEGENSLTAKARIAINHVEHVYLRGSPPRFCILDSAAAACSCWSFAACLRCETNMKFVSAGLCRMSCTGIGDGKNTTDKVTHERKFSIFLRGETEKNEKKEWWWSQSTNEFSRLLALGVLIFFLPCRHYFSRGALWIQLSFLDLAFTPYSGLP